MTFPWRRAGKPPGLTALSVSLVFLLRHRLTPCRCSDAHGSFLQRGLHASSSLCLSQSPSPSSPR